MTVADLIEKLRAMPQNALVQGFFDGRNDDTYIADTVELAEYVVADGKIVWGAPTSAAKVQVVVIS